MDDRALTIEPYDKCTLPFIVHIAVGVIGYAIGFIVFWLFYRINVLAAIGAVFIVPVAISANISASIRGRRRKLLGQFQSLLESLVVSLQAGSPDLAAFHHALGDMELMYSDKADIVKEVKLLITKFENGISIGSSLMDFAERSGLDDVKLFSTVYLSVQGKGDKTREIVIRTQKVLSDKISIQAEIQTLSAGAVMEINIMIVIPVLIVAVMGFMGGELMQGLFTVPGRIAATLSIIIFAGAYFLGKKIVKIDV